MIWMTRAPQDIVIEGVTFTVKPLGALASAEVVDALAGGMTTAAMVVAAKKALSRSLIAARGLVDEAGEPVSLPLVEGFADPEWLDGLPIPVLQELVLGVIDLGKVGDREAKKS